MALPVRSADHLTRCLSCRVHIRAAARPSLTDCPFCGANLHRDRGRWVNTGRSGLLAGALLAFTACSEEPPPEPSPAPPSAQLGQTAPSDPAPSDPASEIEATHEPTDQFEAEPADRPPSAPRYGLAPSPRPQRSIVNPFEPEPGAASEPSVLDPFE